MTITRLASDQPETMIHTERVPLEWTLESALYAVFFFIALILRLISLDYLPLTSSEAQQAMASWNFLRAVPDSFVGSPILFAGNAVVFFLFGATDMGTRILPALFGSALVLIPALLRRELGRPGALIAGALMVFSPSLILFSRQLDSAIMGVASALLVLAFAFRYMSSRESRELNWAATALALALLASSQVWTVVLAMIVFLALARLRNESYGIAQQDARKAALIFGLVFVGVATMFLLKRDGIGAAFNLLGIWLEGLRLNPMPLDPLRLLVLYEPVALFFGVIALVDIGFESRGTTWLKPVNALMVWALVAFAFYSFVGSPDPARAIYIVVPLSLLAGQFIGAWWLRLVDAIRSAPESKTLILSQEVPVFFLALAGFLSIVIAEFTLRGNLTVAESLVMNLKIPLPPGTAGVVIVLILIALAFSALAFLAFTTLGFERTGYLGIVIALTLMFAWTFRQSMMVNFTLAPNVYEWLTPRTSAPNARDLVRDVKNISRWRANDSLTLTIMIDESLRPYTAWGLREFRYAQFVAHPRADENALALLLPVNVRGPLGWIGQAYTLESLQGIAVNPSMLRWLLYRDVGGAQTIDAVLWTPPPQ